MFLHYEYVYMCELWCSDCYIMRLRIWRFVSSQCQRLILQWFMSQDNNIVKICVVNQDEDIFSEVIITTRLVSF